jgi:hypothetical protein
MVFVQETIPYREALREMTASDGLLVFQAGNCNQQIPAKIFEYFRAQKPILTLTDPRGDTAAVMRSAGIHSMVRLDSVEEIQTGLMKFLDQVRNGKAPIATSETVAKYSRKHGAKDLAGLFNVAASAGGA